MISILSFQNSESLSNCTSPALLDKYGLAGTDFVNQLHRELYTADFLSEEAKLDMTEWMAEVDYRLVEGGGEQIQLDALTARLVTHLRT